MQHIKKNWADCRELRYILKETQEIKYGVSTRDGHVVADRCGSSGWCGWKSYAHYPHPEGKKRMVPWSIILLQILFQRCVLLWYHYIYGHLLLSHWRKNSMTILGRTLGDSLTIGCGSCACADDMHMQIYADDAHWQI